MEHFFGMCQMVQSGLTTRRDPMAECPHGLDESWCSLCLHPPRPDRGILTMSLLKARFSGHCKGCNLGISPGQMIYKMSNGTYVHEGCE